jgi:hypothetical protein
MGENFFISYVAMNFGSFWPVTLPAFYLTLERCVASLGSLEVDLPDLPVNIKTVN